MSIVFFTAIVLFLILTTQQFVITPLAWFDSLHLPNWLALGLAFSLFAWLIGDNSKQP